MYGLGLVTLLLFIVGPLKAETIVARVALWATGWLGLHFFIYHLLTKTEMTPNWLRYSRFFSMVKDLQIELKNNPKSRRLNNLTRLLRSQVYCIFATCAGTTLLVNYYHNWPMDLLHFWKPSLSIYFEIAAANWVVSLIEDFWSGREIVSHLTLTATEYEPQYHSMRVGLIAHHTLTTFAYLWCIRTHYLSGLCVFGLMFETPVLFLNVRDIMASFEKELNYPWKGVSENTVRTFLICKHLLFHITRSGACFLWPLSICIWRKELTTVPIYSRLVYHFLGVSFIYVNSVVLAVYVMRFSFDDLMRSGVLSVEEWEQIVARKKTKKSVALDEVTKADSDSSGTDDVEKAQGETHTSSTARLLGMKELAEHSTPDDAWIAISNNVYDITNFMHEHPGGAAVLKRLAGKDGSSEFLAVGHSQKARKLMNDYLVGHIIPGGYEQISLKETEMEDNLVQEEVELQQMLKRPYVSDYNYMNETEPLITCLPMFVGFILFFSAALKEDMTGVDGKSNYLKDFSVVQLAITSFEHVLGMLAIGLVVAFCCRTQSFLRSLASLTVHISAFTLLVSILLDVMMINMIKHNLNAIAIIRASLIATAALEILFRRCGTYLLAAPCSSIYAIIVRLFRVIWNGAFFLMGCTASFEMYSIFMEVSEKDSPYKARVVLTIMLFAALFRCLFIRFHIFDRNADSGFHQSTFQVFCIAMGYAIGLIDFLMWVHQQHYTKTLLVSTSIMNTWENCFDVRLVVTYVLWIAFVGSINKLIRWSNECFISQFICILSIVVLFVAKGPTPHYGMKWYYFVDLFFAAVFCLSQEMYWTLKILGGDAPNHLYSTKQIEDGIRALIAHDVLVRFIVLPLVAVASFVAPAGYRYYMFPGIVYDLGPKCDIGLALQINGNPQKEPKVFQANIGYLGDLDYQQTCASTRDMMQDILDDPEAGEKGFVMDLVALFPLNRSPMKEHFGYDYREFNFSAWTSEKAAHDWYKTNQSHKQIVKKYYNANLNDFSALIASLVPHSERAIRWDVRCKGCRKIVKGPKCDECPYCSADMRGMPYM